MAKTNSSKNHSSLGRAVGSNVNSDRNPVRKSCQFHVHSLLLEVRWNKCKLSVGSISLWVMSYSIEQETLVRNLSTFAFKTVPLLRYSHHTETYSKNRKNASCSSELCHLANTLLRALRLVISDSAGNEESWKHLPKGLSTKMHFWRSPQPRHASFSVSHAPRFSQVLHEAAVPICFHG